MGFRTSAIAIALAAAAATLLSTTPAVAVDPVPQPAEMRLADVSFVGEDMGWAVGEGVLATDDGGATWYRQFAPVERLNAIDMGTSKRGCAVGEGGTIIRTIDGGRSWAEHESGVTTDLYDVDFVDSSRGWAVGPQMTVLRTTDGGITWTRCYPPDGGFSGRRLLAVSFVDATHGWICGDSLYAGDGFDDLYVARTTDGGSTWTRCSNGTYMPGGSDDMWEFRDIDFVNTTTGWVGGWLPGIRRTTNGAADWTTQSLSGVEGLDFWDVQAGVVVAGGHASYTTDGGVHWTPGDLSFDDLVFGQTGDVCMSSVSEVWTVGGSYPHESYQVQGRIAHSTNGGANWHIQPSSTGPVHFLGGTTRYETACNIARLTDVPAGTVVLATGRNFPDALAASGLAGVLDATLLLTDTELPTVVEDTIADLGATHVIIVGGSDVVSDSIRDRLAANHTVERIDGADRYETAANVARRMVDEGASAEEVFVVSGRDFADAASAASLSYSRNMPILLVRPDLLPAATDEVLRELGTLHPYVVGGDAAVGAAVLDEIDEGIPPHLGYSERVADGVDRYDTSVKLGVWAESKSWLDFSVVGFATGRNFPDALTGGALMGSRGGAVLLTDPVTLSPEVDSLVAARPVASAWLMNDRGDGAIQDPVGTRIAFLLR